MKYKGELGKPRKYRPLQGPSEEEHRAWRDAEAKEIVGVINAVFEAHSVPRGDYRKLAFALIAAHVPAWREEKAPRGPKNKWTPILEAELRVAVEEWIAKKEGTSSVVQACSQLKNKSPWKHLLTKAKKDPATALSKHFYKADTAMVEEVRRKHAWSAKQNPLVAFDPEMWAIIEYNLFHKDGLDEQ